MRLTDWRGNEYGVGDRVIYGAHLGRGIQMVEATVLDIWTTYYCPEDYKWKRLAEGEAIPMQMQWGWDGLERAQRLREVENGIRVRLQPVEQTSRTNRTNYSYVDKPDGSYERVPGPAKAVTLQIIENITFMKGADCEEV